MGDSNGCEVNPLQLYCVLAGHTQWREAAGSLPWGGSDNQGRDSLPVRVTTFVEHP